MNFTSLNYSHIGVFWWVFRQRVGLDESGRSAEIMDVINRLEVILENNFVPQYRKSRQIDPYSGKAPVTHWNTEDVPQRGQR